jgi:hypothetical protein
MLLVVHLILKLCHVQLVVQDVSHIPLAQPTLHHQFVQLPILQKPQLDVIGMLLLPNAGLDNALTIQLPLQMQTVTHT